MSAAERPVPDGAVMIEADREAFGAAWSEMLEGQAGDRQLTEDARLRVGNSAFRLLAPRYGLEEVRAALDAHRLRSVYVAKVADVVRLLDGELPGVDVLRALALDRDEPTPLGVMVRRLVGEHTMTTGDEYTVNAAIRGKLAKLDAFRRRALVGALEEDELRRIVAAGCRPSAELAPGVPGCRAPYLQLLEQEFRRLRAEKKLAGPASLRSTGAPSTAVDPEANEAARAEAMAKVRAVFGATDASREAERAASLERDEGRATA